MRRGGNKYRAKKTTCIHGHSHDSKGEAGRCIELHMLQNAGAISRLTIHPKFKFSIDGTELKYGNGHKVGVTLDFEYFEGNKHIAEEFKGYVVRDWPLRRVIFKALHPYIELREIRK